MITMIVLCCIFNILHGFCNHEKLPVYIDDLQCFYGGLEVLDLPVHLATLTIVGLSDRL